MSIKHFVFLALVVCLLAGGAEVGSTSLERFQIGYTDLRHTGGFS